MPSTTSATRRHACAADLLRTAADPTLTEDLALALLKRADLPAEVLEQLAKNANALKSRKVKIALASHPHTPRHVSVPLARQFYTFDLMKVALSPGVPADVKVAVDDVLISRLKTVTIGERLTLARRASGRVAAALLLEVEIGEAKSVDGKVIGRQNRSSRDPSHADRARKPAPHRSPRHQFRASSRRQRSPGACGRAAREVVPPQRNPRRPSANRASLAGPRPRIQPRNPRPAAAGITRQFASPRPKSKTNSSARILA